MDVSIFLSHQRIGAPGAEDRTLYDEKLVEAKLADALGFACIWVPEHHLIHFMQAPSGLLLAVHYGAHTKCKVGQMVNLLLYRHPLVTAGEIAQADMLLNGRLQLGVGRGAYNYEFKRLGISWDIAEAKFLECLDVLEKVWANPDMGITFKGKFFEFEKTYVWPRPHGRRAPEVWYAAMTPPVIEFAAQRGYNVATWPFLRPMSFVEDIARKFHAAREKAGHAAGAQKLAVMRPVFVARTEAEARKAVPTMLNNHRISQLIRAPEAELDDKGYIAPKQIENEPSLDDAFDVMIAGTPDQCLEKLAQYRALGVDQFIAWFDFGLPHAQVTESMRLFGEEVLTKMDGASPKSRSSSVAA